MSRIPWAFLSLLAVPALALARLAPETGWGLGLRLAAATACLLLPGFLIAAALRVPGFSAAFAWSFGALFVATAVMFLVHSSLTWALILLVAITAAAAVVVFLRPAGDPPGQVSGLPVLVPLGVALAGVGFGIALWFLMGHLTGGDDLFHLARVRKLEDLGSLSLRTVDEFRDGGLHPGYAFPLWHCFLALVARLAGVDPTAVIQHEASVLVPVAFLVAWESGKEVFRSAWGGLAVLATSVGIFALAAGNGGSFTALALPATASRQLFVPGVIAVFFAFVAERSRAGLATIACATGALALIHPTYALFVLIPLIGFVAARALLARREVAEGLLGLAAVVVPAGLVALWLRPIARETASVNPSADEVHRALDHYKGQLDRFSDGSYRLAPEVLGRSGALAIAALLSVPLAVLAARRRWAAFVLGGFVLVLTLLLLPELFTRFADAVSISQARRAAGFVPFGFALAGGAAVLARLTWLVALPIGLGAGTPQQHA